MERRSKNKSQQNGTPGRKRARSENSRVVAACKRKSLRLQHSMSLHIPLDEMDSTIRGMNCYIDLPPQVFSLTYLDADDTQNPASLSSLDQLKSQRWQTYLVGFLFNFKYQKSQLKSVAESISRTLNTQFHNSNTDITYITEVTTVDDLNPTENDNKALLVTVVARTEPKERLLYTGYLVSWCNPVQQNGINLPLLLCRGNMKYRPVIHSVLSERFDVNLTKLELNQEDFMHLITYCIIMLAENDSYVAKISYKIPPGTINLEMSVEYLLKLWNNIHKGGSNDIEFDEIIIFHEALEGFYESTFGIKLGYTHLQSINVKGCFGLQTNGQIWCKSTRILHVVLKYLVYLAIQKLKVKTSGYIVQEKPSVCSKKS